MVDLRVVHSDDEDLSQIQPKEKQVWRVDVPMSVRYVNTTIGQFYLMSKMISAVKWKIAKESRCASDANAAFIYV